MNSIARTRPALKLPRISLNKRVVWILVGLLIVIALGYFLTRQSTFTTTSSQAAATNGDKLAIQPAKSTLPINKQFEFPFQGTDPKKVEKFKYSIETAELRDEIVVNGKKAQAVQGRQFLILNIKIVNDFNQSISINAKDYVRLSVNGNQSEWLAPDINNDPVTVQPISTKYTRLGFPINISDANVKLQVGEINGEKTSIDVNF